MALETAVDRLFEVGGACEQSEFCLDIAGFGMIPSHFAHRQAPSKLVYGNGCLAQLKSELGEISIRRPILVAGRRTAASMVYRNTITALSGLDLAEYIGMPEHSPIGEVERLRDLARSHGADGFIAVGGGSASDACKAAALWLAEDRDLESCATRFSPPSEIFVPHLDKPKLPIVAIPTTLSAAEVTPGGSVCTQDGRKLILVDFKLASQLIVIDPAAVTDVPAHIFLASGMNGLAHCIEGLYSKVQTPVTTALALHAIGLFMEALPAVASDPSSADARGKALMAAHLSGLALLNARTCIHHATCHALGAVAGISHGDANSILLPHAMVFNSVSPIAASAMAACAIQLGASVASAQASIDRVRWLQERIGVRRRLRDTGMLRELIPEVAAKVMGEKGLYFNPRTVSSAEQVQEMLYAAW